MEPSTRRETIMGTTGNFTHRKPWKMEGLVRELALFNLGIDSKLRIYRLTKKAVSSTSTNQAQPVSST